MRERSRPTGLSSGSPPRIAAASRSGLARSGWAMDPALLLLILTVVTYFAALIVIGARRFRSRVDVR